MNRDMYIYAQAILEQMNEEGLDASFKVIMKNGKYKYTISFAERVEETPTTNEDVPPPHKLEEDETDLPSTEYTELCAFRTKCAKHENIAAFQVASNKLLIAIENKRPSSLKELSTIKGIGQLKMSKYGEHFISIIGGMSADEAFANFLKKTSPPSPKGSPKSQSQSQSHSDKKFKLAVSSEKDDDLVRWRPSQQLINYYAKGKAVSPTSQFGRWCAYHKYDPSDVISGKIRVKSL